MCRDGGTKCDAGIWVIDLRTGAAVGLYQDDGHFIEDWRQFAVWRLKFSVKNAGFWVIKEQDWVRMAVTE